MPADDGAPAYSGVPQLPVDSEEIVRALKGLGSEARIEIIKFLARPHYLEEIASYLGIARQSAQHHVDKLLEAGMIRKQRGERDSGPVTDYVVAPQEFFKLGEDFFQLGTLRRAATGERAERTEQTAMPSAGQRSRRGPCLVEVHGVRRGAEHRLAGDGPWTLGRDEGRTIRIEHDPFASGKHAQIVAEEGTWILVDTFSTNGTFVNFRLLPEGGKHELEPGDIVGVGKSLFVYWG